MAKDRIVSVAEAAKIRQQTHEGIMKAVATGRLHFHRFSTKGFMLSERQVRGLDFSRAEFERLCGLYVSVPDACNICCKTDASIIRDLKSGKLKGFRLNNRSWAVLRSSAEAEFEEYLQNHKSRVGRKRDVGKSRSPRDLRKKTTKRAASKVQSQRGAN